MLLLSLPLLVRAQATPPSEPFALRHTFFAGVQLPLSYTAGYQAQFSRRFSARVQGGLIVPPFDRYTIKTLEGFGLDHQLGDAIDRSFQRGTLLSVGVNVHANSPWYAGLLGQYVHLTAGPITPADGLGLYFKRDFSAFGLLASPALVFEMQSNLWLGGLRIGRAFLFTNSHFGLNLEAGLGKIFATRNTFASNRSLVDALGVTQQLYSDLDHEVDSSLRKNGYLPTLDVLLTYRLDGRP
ncbi:hypothetical protein BEN49_05705 [Hymenobacter coccineus]|uniref:Outer membrane protein beta-barrel domain-containing protein n=1 Tax=Hymenobacter coccineus TaxID=1908235 RepID=A0A1G1TJC9_9BACT|nr:hypothetical protein BEN49_05705 [Hymenobacter coccineus]